MNEQAPGVTKNKARILSVSFVLLGTLLYVPFGHLVFGVSYGELVARGYFGVIGALIGVCVYIDLTK